MTFRQNACSFYELELVFSLFACLCLALIPVLGTALSICPAAFCVGLFLVNFRWMNTWVTVDEKGIACTRAGKPLWTYRWDEIAAMKRFSHLAHPAFGILLYDSERKPEQVSARDRYFQLSGKAKKALEAYCKNGEVWSK